MRHIQVQLCLEINFFLKLIFNYLILELNIMDPKNEVWKKVNYPGLENKYDISNYGKIYSYFLKKIKKTRENCCGYEVFTYSLNGITKSLSVHRLVAFTFIPNIENKPIVNHKDHNRLNNNVDNLEWMTYSENSKHSYKVLPEINPISEKLPIIHKQIPCFSNYEINENGDVYSLVSKRYLNQQSNNFGYKSVKLFNDDNIRMDMRIHRLVAFTYIGIPPKNKNIINHKDGNPSNNNYINLEWCNTAENTQHAHDNNLINKYYIKICQFNIFNGHFIKMYNSIKEASEKTNIDETDISRACRYIRKTAGNYIWKLEKDCIKIGDTYKNIIIPKICKFAKDEKFIKLYDSIKQVCKEHKCYESDIRNVCDLERKTYMKFIWRYEIDCNKENEIYTLGKNKYVGKNNRIKDIIHKPINYFEKYEITHDGRVYNTKNNMYLKTFESEKGYLKVNLFLDNNKKNTLNINILVADAYLIKPSEKNLVVNHKDGNPKNNNYINLEWTCEYNKYCNEHDHGLLDNDNRKKVYQFDKNGIFIKKFASCESAHIITKYNRAHIYSVCKFERRMCNGFIWRYEEDVEEINNTYINNTPVPINKKKRKICQFDLSNTFIKMYESGVDAEKSTRVGKKLIQRVCVQKENYKSGGFKWRYEDECMQLLDNTYIMIEFI